MNRTRSTPWCSFNPYPSSIATPSIYVISCCSRKNISPSTSSPCVYTSKYCNAENNKNYLYLILSGWWINWEINTYMYVLNRQWRFRAILSIICNHEILPGIWTRSMIHSTLISSISLEHKESVIIIFLNVDWIDVYKIVIFWVRYFILSKAHV